MPTSNDLFYPQNDTWINERTGEKVTGPMNIRKVSRENFEILYASALYDLHNAFGNKKLKVLDVILQNRNSDNITIMTQERLAEIAKVSKPTVVEALKILEERGAIKKKNGVIFVNPLLMNHSSAEKEKWLIIKFEEFDNTQSITRGRTFKKDQRKERKINKEKIKNLDTVDA